MKHQKVGSFLMLHDRRLIISKTAYRQIRSLSDEKLLQSVNAPRNRDYLLVNTNTGRLVDGNTRLYELKRRGMDETLVPYKEYTPLSLDFLNLE